MLSELFDFQSPWVLNLSETLRLQDLIKDTRGRSGSTQPLKLKTDLPSLKELLQTLASGQVPVLLNTYWKEEQVQAALDQVPQELPAGSIVLFTSGTSGRPKAVVHTLSTLLSNARMANRRHPLNSDSIWLLNLPLFHVGGLGIVFRTLEAGAQITFDSRSATHLSVVPTQLHRLLRSGESLDHLRLILLGGAPAGRSLLQEARHLPLARTYGMTEAASQITTTDILDPKSDLSLSGLPLEGVDVRISEDHHIEFQSPSLALGYLQDQKLVPFLKEEYFRTQDLGELTPKGLLVHGRTDRAFKCAGDWVQPERIEAIALDFPGVIEAKVMAHSDPEFGQVPVLYLRKDSQFEDETFQSHLKGRLTGLERPRQILSYDLLDDLKSRL